MPSDPANKKPADPSSFRDSGIDPALDENAAHFYPQIGITSVPDATAYDRGQPQFDPHTDLLRLRSQFPFLPIMPFPTAIHAVCLAAGIPQELKIADGTTVAMFFGSKDFFLSKLGNAEIPTAANALAQTSKSIYKPDRFMFYMRGVKSVSVIAPAADTVVQALCYITDMWPK